MKSIASKIKTKKVVSIFLALCMIIAPMSLIVTAATDSETFSVSTSEDFINAVKTINSGTDDKKYVIEMENDITISDRTLKNNNVALQFNKGITTIYGNGHTLSGSIVDDTLIYLKGDNVIVNLGSSDNPEKSKIDIKGPASDIVGINSGTVNMYNGVVLRDNQGLGRLGGAVSVGETIEGEAASIAKFNMYGGTITNCQNTYTNYGGAVLVALDGTFNMSSGTIENNTAGVYGGGVFIMGIFNMSGGVIQKNSVNNEYYQGNEAYYPIGGGVCNAGSFTMEGGVIQNNTAAIAADDIYSAGVTKINVAANADNGFGKLIATNKQINGWFDDGDTRWDANDYCVEVSAETASASDAVSLKAAHSAGVQVTFDVNAGVWNDTTGKFTDNKNNTYSENLAAGDIADMPVEPTRTDYNFLGWFTKEGTEYDFNTAVNEDITLYAKWEYNNYKKSVTLDKIYLISDGYTDAGDVISSNGKITEEITLTIEEYKSFNREIGKTDIPGFAENVYKFTTGIGADEIQITLPDFKDFGVGDYWYKVTELEGNIAGISYDTNEYYMHIVVTHDDDSNPDDAGVSAITFHKNAPDEDGTYNNDASNKATGFTNTYGAGSLTITKDIKGNFSDRTKTFDVNVTFNAPDGKTVTGNIYYGDGTVAISASDWNESAASVTITLGLGDSITFTNIPDGVTYKIAENDYSSDGYVNPVYTFDNETEAGDTANSGAEWAANNAQGTITDDSDVVTITNEKNTTIDVGVILDNTPYVLIILFVISTAAVMFVKHHKASDAE